MGTACPMVFAVPSVVAVDNLAFFAAAHLVMAYSEEFAGDRTVLGLELTVRSLDCLMTEAFVLLNLFR